MSLYVLPVTSTDISQVQTGILFSTTNQTDINNQVAAINATPNPTETVASYANTLLAQSLTTGQMAMGVTALMTGQSQTTAVLTNLVTNPQIIPLYQAFAVAQNLDVGQVVGEDLGLAFSGTPNFPGTYGNLSLANFASAAAAVTGINSQELLTTAQFFIGFYTANGIPGIAAPTAAQIQDAAYGVAFGLGVALALEGIGTQATTIQTQVKNALFDIVQTNQSPPGTAYVAGIPLGGQGVPIPFQGGPNPTSATLTPNADTPTTGFTSGTGFTATTPGVAFLAPSITQTSGAVQQTISTGDNLVDTVGDGTLGSATSNAILTGDNVTGGQTNGFNFNGITTAFLQAPNTVNPFTLTPGNTFGFRGTTAGSEKGLVTVNNNGSTGFILLGAANQGLGTVLTTYNSVNATNGFFAVVQASQFTGKDTITANITGNLGFRNTTGTVTQFGGSSVKLGFAPDTGVNGYVNWTIGAATGNQEILRLGQGLGATAFGDGGAGIGAAANLVLTNVAGATGAGGTFELNALQGGDFANLKTIDGTNSSGMTLTGFQSNKSGGYYTGVGVAVNPAGTVNEAGLLTSSATNIIAPTSIKGSLTGTNFVDLSGLTAAAINAMTTIAGNTAGGVTNTLILPNAVVEQAGALGNLSGYQVIGDPAITGGTINMANFAGANTLALYGPEAVNIALVNIINAPTNFTFSMRGNTSELLPVLPILGFHNYAITGPGGTYTGTNNIFNLNMGTATHVNGVGGANVLDPGGEGGNTAAAAAHNDVIGFFGILGPGLVVNNYEIANFNIVDGPPLPVIIPILAPIANFPDLIFGGIKFAPQVGGGEVLNLNGTGDLIALINLVPGNPFADVVSTTNNFLINDNLGGVFAFGGTNALQIQGANSGGVVEVGGFNTNPAGATDVGSTTHWNALVGSQTVDTLTGGSGQFSPLIAIQGDVYGPNGGTGAGHGDTVNLAAGHALNHIDVYGTMGGVSTADGLNYAPVTDSITGPTVAGPFGPASTVDQYLPGWGGVAAGGAPIQFGAGTGVGGTVLQVDNNAVVAPATSWSGGTSNSQVIVNGGFVTGPHTIGATGDTVEFSVGAWGAGAMAANATFGVPAGGTAFGLTNGDLVTPVTTNTNSTPQLVTGGVGVINAATNVVELTNIEANANALAGFLHSQGGNLTFAAALGAGDTAHMIFAYSDGANVHLADVEFFRNTTDALATGASTDHMTAIAATDMVQLTGIASVTALNAGNIHFLA